MTTVWGQLPKAQDDPRTIQEYIDEKIAEHNSEILAHLKEGQSIDQHRKEQVADHPARSIVNDKVRLGAISLEHFAQDRVWFLSTFEGGEGWNKLNEFSILPGSAVLQTDDQEGEYSVIGALHGSYNVPLWDDDFVWQSTVSIRDPDNNKVTIGACASTIFQGHRDGAFFFYDDGTMYVGTSKDFGDESLEQIDPPNTGATVYNTYRIYYQKEKDELHFYMNGELKKTIEQPEKKGEPTGFGSFEVITKANETKRITAADMIMICRAPR